MTEIKKGGGDDVFDYSLYFPFNGIIQIDASSNPPTTNPIVPPAPAGPKPSFSVILRNAQVPTRNYSSPQNIIGERILIKGNVRFRNLVNAGNLSGYQIGTVNTISFQFPPGFSTEYTVWRQGYTKGTINGKTRGTSVTAPCNLVSSNADYFVDIWMDRIVPKSVMNEEVIIKASGINCTNSIASASVSF